MINVLSDNYYIIKMTTVIDVMKRIPIKYTTDDYNVSFGLKFGLGIDSAIQPDEDVRTDYKISYDIEKLEVGDQNGYRVLAHEGPLVIDVSNVNIWSNSYDSNYEYALGIVFDFSEPKYNTEGSITPNNIERDGVMWNIPSDSYDNNHRFDQNGNAKYQIVLRRAMEMGYKPTEEETKMGLEETSQTTGLMYITFMVFRKERRVYRSRGGGSTRGITRGGGGDAARIGYGSSAATNSKQSEYGYAPNTKKYILPIRYRIVEESEVSNINCAKDLQSAMRVEELNAKTAVIPL